MFYVNQYTKLGKKLIERYELDRFIQIRGRLW
jgi:hypothetical protein